MRQAFGQEHLSRKVDTLDYSMSKASTKVIQKVIMNNPNIIIGKCTNWHNIKHVILNLLTTKKLRNMDKLLTYT